MRIFAAGIATESNTYAPLPTALEDFQIQRGRDVLAGRIDYPSLDLSAIWGRLARERGHDFVFSLMTFAQPSGVTTRAAYESLRDEVLEDLKAALPVDVVLLHLHGAMVAQGYDDCEEDLLRRVREIVGPRAVVGVELDLHCHLSESMIAPADIVITYKEYPHDDINDRAVELFELAVTAQAGRVRPKMALFDCRMIGLYPTTREPMRGFVDAMTQRQGHDGVLSISFGHGFQFADLPHVGAKVLVVTDNDQDLAQQVAREFGMRVHALRHEIGFESLSLPLEAALSRALAAQKGPVVVADQSDNAGGGAPGDSTYALQWLLAHDAQDVALAILYDPEVVRTARRAGEGATLRVRLGGKLGEHSGQPVDIDVTVLATKRQYVHAWPQRSGDPVLSRLGDVAALRHGSIDIVVSSERCQCFSPAVFSDLGIDPRRKRVLVVKSYQHFYGAFAPLAAEVVYMAGPGAVPPDPRQIEYRRLDTRRLYPWVRDPFL